MDQAAILQARAFNRTVAERIGAISDHFLGRPRPLGESRALWEIGPDGLEVRKLRARLGLDSGYASRVLRSLEQQGLITVTPSKDDARVRHAHLTRAGRREHAAINRRSDAVAWGLLEPLNTGQRTRLVTAMAEVERLLRASMVRVAVEAPDTQDAGWCLRQYFAELNQRFETGYDPDHALAVAAPDITPPAGALLLVWLREQPVGCGSLKLHPGEPAEIKRIWVSQDVRGLGVGRRLLSALEDHARDAGAPAVRLDTNRALHEAIALYRSTGYCEVPPYNNEPYAHYWFEKPLSQPPGS
jgi:DNA-binding MarR family transcriptional regulator/GNAT superfamily N-acetyltransferase